ncbi:WD40 repeat-like protein [Lepidopterella palustris CBS 459.81]|uniref:WD40 repeat-like protein n=1 Tax=Lepidopterella palustris CBS 459.81 TaxID=1314670 RepID=A0A8E2ELN4_9PEZI|nr:WD40 repeat-like protein [Lepidopterella palustris CBS 459.81]
MQSSPSNAHVESIVTSQYGSQADQRLETNWNAGRFSNFYFPHPDHLDESHTAKVYCVTSSEKYLVSCSGDKSIRIWNLETQRLVVPPLLGHEESVLYVQFDEKEDIVISGGADAHVFIWQFSTGKLIRWIRKAHAESVLSLKFNDQYLVTTSKDKSIKVWDRRELDLTSTNDSTTNGLGLSPALTLQSGLSAAVIAVLLTEKHVISGSGDKRIKIWDIITGKCLNTISVHEKGIATLNLSPDGRRIISGSSDNTIRIIDIASGAELSCLNGHTNIVRSVALQSSGSDLANRMVSGSYDGTIIIWRQKADEQWEVDRTLSVQEAFRDEHGLPIGRLTEQEISSGWRVFSVQVSSRWIISGVQATTIVGWDFDI